MIRLHIRDKIGASRIKQFIILHRVLKLSFKDTFRLIREIATNRVVVLQAMNSKNSEYIDGILESNYFNLNKRFNTRLFVITTPNITYLDYLYSPSMANSDIQIIVKDDKKNLVCASFINKINY